MFLDSFSQMFCYLMLAYISCILVLRFSCSKYRCDFSVMFLGNRLLSSVFTCSTKLIFASRMPEVPLLSTWMTKRFYRKLQKEEKDNVTVIKGELYKDHDTPYVKKGVETDPCPLRSRGIQVTYEDVLILQQFITSTGEMLPRHETNLSQNEFFKVLTCVKMAQRANLLPGKEDQHNIQGKVVPKLNRYLTRYNIGSRTPIRSRGLPHTKRHYKIGDRRLARDAPRVGRRSVALDH